MKFSLITVLALSGSALCSPYVSTAPDDKRLDQANAIFSQLYQQVQQITAQINQTTSSVSGQTSAQQKQAAAQIVAADIGKINDLVTGAKTQISALKKSGSSSSKSRVAMFGKKPDYKDPKAAAIAGTFANVLLDIQGTVNKVKGTFGSSPPIDIQINKLVGSLSGLLISLRDVLDNVLELVKELLDGLLTGLSGGLTILTLPKDLVGKLGKGLSNLPGYLGSLLGGKGKGNDQGSDLSGNLTTNATAPLASPAPVANTTAPLSAPLPAGNDTAASAASPLPAGNEPLPINGTAALPSAALGAAAAAAPSPVRAGSH